MLIATSHMAVIMPKRTKNKRNAAVASALLEPDRGFKPRKYEEAVMQTAGEGAAQVAGHKELEQVDTCQQEAQLFQGHTAVWPMPQCMHSPLKRRGMYVHTYGKQRHVHASLL